jgi:transcriptional regulator with XRE-family HTH domain
MTEKKQNKTYDEEHVGTGVRFEKVAEVFFGGNKSALARALSMKPGSFTKYLRGDRTPGAKILERLTRMGVNVNWFLTGDGPMIIPGEGPSPSSSASKNDQGMSAAELQNDPARYYPIPRVQVRLTESGDLRLDEVGEPEWLSEEFIRGQYDTEPDRLREFQVSSNRMAGTIRTGDRVRVALLPADFPAHGLNDGSVYLFFGPDGVFVARAFRDEDGSGIQLVGDNPEGRDVDVPEEEWGAPVRPIARVLEAIRPL